nr:MAG TPA: hypothetical protein [Caudoviricetes sp.]DAM09055.1 MAG TPA: hypothetical protein [Caudoviricetes sp.]DAM12531.1 MAG TPA: hypothetical protein [Caudoviricetes sp.]DAV74204.1 MAG TPA: hypothetical protein [Caudoviricetes sp.]
MCGSHLCGEPGLEPGRVVFLRLYDFKSFYLRCLAGCRLGY